MTVWIVLRFKGSGYVVDEVFDNEKAALDHRKNMTSKWVLSKVTEHEVKSL